MFFVKLLADNALMRLILGNPAQRALVVSMVGVKMGERVLVLGMADRTLLAALGSKVGLTGRACGIDVTAEAINRAQHYADREGVLVETLPGAFASPPYEPSSFDLVVIRVLGSLLDDSPLAAAIAGARSVLRDGGRCSVIGNTARPGFLGLTRRSVGGPVPTRLVSMLIDAGFIGARVLVQREGLAFVEAISRVASV